MNFVNIIYYIAIIKSYILNKCHHQLDDNLLCKILHLLMKNYCKLLLEHYLLTNNYYHKYRFKGKSYTVMFKSQVTIIKLLYVITEASKS